MTSPIGGIGPGTIDRFQRAAQSAVDGGIQVPFTKPDGGATPTFAETLTNALGEVSAAQDRSGAMAQAFARGEDVELHQVMAAAEEAGLSLELLVEVKNKFTEAYRTVINMQS